MRPRRFEKSLFLSTKMDRYLDQSQNGALLYGEVLAKIRDYYLGYDKNIFEIEALSVMPNHIHVLLKQNDNMTNVMRVLKGGAGYLVNIFLKIVNYRIVREKKIEKVKDGVQVSIKNSDNENIAMLSIDGEAIVFELQMCKKVLLGLRS